MDTVNTTLKFYNKNANAFFDETFKIDMRPFYSEFLPLLPEKGRILDVGCGSGRDTLYFMNHGYSVIAVDGSKELCKLVRDKLHIDVQCKTFDELDYYDSFHGVWACSSLLHIPKEDIHRVISRISESLKLHGVLYCSFKYGNTQRVDSGKIYSDYTEKDLPFLFNDRNGLVCTKWWISSDQRQNNSSTKWLNIVCIKN